LLKLISAVITFPLQTNTFQNGRIKCNFLGTGSYDMSDWRLLPIAA